MDQISRRKFLQIAGGITFLSLTPAGKGLFGAPKNGGSLPLFTVIPYIQPGPASTLLEGQDTLVVAWQTENLPAAFVVRYGLGKKMDRVAKVTAGERAVGASVATFALGAPGSIAGGDDTKRLNYAATLTGMQLNKKYHYQVIGNGQLIVEGYATTRKPRGKAIRFAAFGDNSCNDIGSGYFSDRAIAYRAYCSNPDFVMNTGDNVYESGLDGEYTTNFFPVYNADSASLQTGAPLLRSVPFYTVMANHDVAGKARFPAHPTGPEACADFNRDPDALGYYTAMHLPANGPQLLSSPTPVVCDDPAIIAQFKSCAAGRFPAMANYSFDYGDVHFLCLDSNVYVDPTDAALQSWIASDLSSIEAIWKFVVYHHPAFNVGGEHYREQQMRVLSPLFERHGVDIVLHGHEHTYQRTRPIRFVPSNTAKAGDVTTGDRRVPGTFTVDTDFDGITKTIPNGIIYVTTGAGGKVLYEPGFTDNPSSWLHSDDNNVAYVAKFYSLLHSLTLFEVDGKTVKWSQQTESGLTIDQVTVTKA